MKQLFIILLYFLTINCFSQKEKLMNCIWKIDYYIIKNFKSLPKKTNINDEIIFKENNKLVLVEEDNKVTGKWSYLENKKVIKIKIDGFPIEIPFKIKLLNEKTFAWETIDEETGFKKTTYYKKL